MEPTRTNQTKLTVCEGETVTLDSSFDFSNFVEVSWKKPTRDGLESVTNGVYNPCDFSYTIDDVSQSDSKVYTPTAVNPMESFPKTGASTELIVLPQPSKGVQ